MRHAIGLFAIPLVAVTAFADTPKAPPQAPQLPKDAALSERTALLEPIQVESLTLTPIVATPAALKDTKDDVLLVLDEAMAAKKVKIQEIADSSVNNLTFVNKADHSVFVLAG